MSVMRFNNHCISACQGRGRVTTSDRKRQREITRSKNYNWAKRSQQRADIGLGNWFTIGIVMVYSCIHPRTFFNHIGEQTQLVASTTTLRRNASFRQASFLGRTLDQHIAKRFNISGDLAQKLSSCLLYTSPSPRDS